MVLVGVWMGRSCESPDETEKQMAAQAIPACASTAAEGPGIPARRSGNTGWYSQSSHLPYAQGVSRLFRMIVRGWLRWLLWESG